MPLDFAIYYYICDLKRYFLLKNLKNASLLWVMRCVNRDENRSKIY